MENSDMRYGEISIAIKPIIPKIVDLGEFNSDSFHETSPKLGCYEPYSELYQ